MKNSVLFLLLLALVVGACKKEEEKDDQATIDDKIITDYLSSHSLSATKHESGMYYIIHKEGSGDHPTLSNKVVVDYKGYYPNDVVFDERVSEFWMSGVITGFQIGVGMLRPGGSGTFYLPSALAYGETGKGSIPPNAVLIFDVELVEFY